MRKKIDRFIFGIARSGLVIAMILCVMSAMAAIITVTFNLNGQIRLTKKSWTRLSEFGPGIPFHATLNAPIPDSSIVTEKGGGRALHNYYPEGRATGSLLFDSADYSDKILADFKVRNTQSESKDFKVSSANLTTAVFYVQPNKFWDRILLSIPRILPLLLIAFCAWQLLQLIRAIDSGTSFTQSSPKRIAGIGWAILFTGLILFILDILQNSLASISLSFSSTIPNYRVPFDATAYKEGFPIFNWLVIGAIILIVAKAFKYGNQLQKYEDLTV